MKRLILAGALLISGAGTGFAADDLVSVQTADGAKFSYVLTTNAPQKPAYAVILMPGGGGQLNPRLDGGKLVMAFSGNFLIRSRALFADGQFVAASTDATSTTSRIAAIVADLGKRFGKLDVYVVGTSASTNATLSLAETMDGQVAGFVHSSSFNRISSFDPRKLKSRHLIVIHDKDSCRYTLPANGQRSNTSYGTELIVMQGGKSTGDECEAYAYHGYYGIEKETVDRIKAWIAKGR
jgi:hypothetical protein